jgi:hypothetical protein
VPVDPTRDPMRSRPSSVEKIARPPCPLTIGRSFSFAVVCWALLHKLKFSTSDLEKYLSPQRLAMSTSTEKPVILPKEGIARVKSIMSGDTVILLGKPLDPSKPPPEVIFTFEALSAPR